MQVLPEGQTGGGEVELGFSTRAYGGLLQQLWIEIESLPEVTRSQIIATVSSMQEMIRPAIDEYLSSHPQFDDRPQPLSIEQMYQQGG